MKTRTFLDTTALLVLALFAGCSDAAPPPSTAPVAAHGRGLPVRPDGELFTANASTMKDILPTGKRGDVQDDPNPPPRTRYRAEYHDAPVLEGVQSLYVIYYGNWSTTAEKDELVIYRRFSLLSGLLALLPDRRSIPELRR